MEGVEGMEGMAGKSEMLAVDEPVANVEGRESVESPGEGMKFSSQ